MSLKIYRGEEVQDFRKRNSADLQFGLQIASPIELLSIHEAYESSDLEITSITAVKYDNKKQELSRTDLETDLIVYNSGKSQYLTDITKNYFLEGGIYTIEFVNSARIFKSDPFLVDVSLVGETMSFQVSILSSQTQIFQIIFTGSVFIYWDDGVFEEFTSGGQLSHSYSSDGTYFPVIMGDLDTITYFFVQGRMQEVFDFKSGLLATFNAASVRTAGTLDLSGAAGVSGLFICNFNNAGLGLSKIIFPASGNGLMTTLSVNNNKLIQIDLSNLNLSSALNFYSNPDLAEIIHPSSGNEALIGYVAYSTALPPYDFTDFPTSNGIIIDMKDNNWTATEVDNQLIYLAATGWTGGTLNIAGNNASRTAASDTAYNALVGDSWSITVN